MLAVPHLVAPEAEGFEHFDVLLDYPDQALSRLFVDREPEGETVYAGELRREDRQAVDVDVPAREYSGDGAEQPYLILRIDGYYVHPASSVHFLQTICFLDMQLYYSKQNVYANVRVLSSLCLHHFSGVYHHSLLFFLQPSEVLSQLLFL